MNTLKLAIRRFSRKDEHTLTRIISLALGLAFGILLLSEVLYYYSFDSFYLDANRIYVVHENFKTDKSTNKLESLTRTSGAIAPGLKAEVPGIEAATRLNSIGTSVFYTEDRKSYEAKFSLADEYLFDVLPRPMISGNASEILKMPMTCMVSSKIAEEIGGDVVGKMIELKEYPNRKLAIGGIFKALPENTNYKYDILISMVSTNQFTWDGTQNWLGNDRYYTCVKLATGVNPEGMAAAVRKMQEKHQDIEKLEQQQQGLVLKYSFNPIKKMYLAEVKDMVLVLSLIAFAVLFVSLMNYILLTLSALVNRAKSSAIHKCCGAQAINLQKLIFSETILIFALSLLGAFSIIMAIKPLAESQLQHQLSSVLNPYVIWPLVALMVILVALISYGPALFFSRIPVATAFRSYRQKGNKWKLALLSFQFVGASFILTVLVVVTLQYNKLKDTNHGYRTEGVYYGSTSGMESSKIATVLNELRSLPEIETVGLGCTTPIDAGSGNNIFSPDGQKELFNVADFYWIDENYLSILNIPINEGQNFSQTNCIANDMLISHTGAELLKLNNKWTDGVVGKQITISEHGTTTVRGVFPDFIISSITNPDRRPAVFFYMPEERFEQQRAEKSSFSFNVMIKAHEGMQAGLLKKITDIFNMALLHQDAVIKNLGDEQMKCYVNERGFRNAMMAGNMIILIITGIGLLGYTATEVNRRRKELAIRRISGANQPDILKIFIIDLEYIALPAVSIGLIGAWFISGRWMQNFAIKVSLNWGIFAFCSLTILLMIALITAINYLRVANHNPVEALRYE